jgi:signal transduction histidine kinase
VRPGAADGVHVIVADSGPGMDETDVERGRSGAGSTGLGLDIARRTAESSGGSFRIASSTAGTTVALELRPPSS